MPSVTEDILALVARTRVVDLGRPYAVGMPQSPNHPVYTHALVRRHGDAVRADGGSAANDVVVMGTHVGTHIDALAHVSHDGLLHGGSAADDAQRGGRFDTGGVDTVRPGLLRGVLLDVPAHLGLPACEPAFAITDEVLAATAESQGTRLQEGDAVLVRSGGAQRWADKAAYVQQALQSRAQDFSGYKSEFTRRY